MMHDYYAFYYYKLKGNDITFCFCYHRFLTNTIHLIITFLSLTRVSSCSNCHAIPANLSWRKNYATPSTSANPLTLTTTHVSTSKRGLYWTRKETNKHKYCSLFIVKSVYCMFCFVVVSSPCTCTCMLYNTTLFKKISSPYWYISLQKSLC